MGVRQCASSSPAITATSARSSSRLLRGRHASSALDSYLYERLHLRRAIACRPAIGLQQGRPRHRRRPTCEGFDAVVHLAGLSNDPLGDLSRRSPIDINHSATVRLARIAKEAGVERFVFSSSCSLYGAAGDDWSTRRRPNPVTPYGVSKLRAERDLLAARRRRLLARLPAQRHRLRLLAAHPLRPGASTTSSPTPFTTGRDADEERRHAVAAARPHRGHQPRLHRGARSPARAVHTKSSTSASRPRTTGSAKSPRSSPGRGPRNAGAVRRGRRTRHAQLPRRLRQDLAGRCRGFRPQWTVRSRRRRNSTTRISASRTDASRISKARATSASPI